MVLHLLSYEMDWKTQVQFLDEAAVYFSFRINNLGKGMDLYVLSPTKGE